ncbi:MAG: HAD-IIB family hydrolase [Prosthecobacter sp.]
MPSSTPRLLICTDLDRTLLPNGLQPESPAALPTLRRLVTRHEVALAYVSGRRLELHLEAMRSYDVPKPDYIIADVGASIYHDEGGSWKRDELWFARLSAAWQGREWQDVLPLLSHIEGLVLQPVEAQAPHKLSFNVPNIADHARLLEEVKTRLSKNEIHSHLIWSVDETVGMGLLDVMAEGATKLHAVEWLISCTGTPHERVLYAGDSGNDLEVLTSGIRSVLVANATNEVRMEAIAGSAVHPESLYLAGGDTLGMNGCYSAGILEGVLHFFPELAGWMTEPQTD